MSRTSAREYALKVLYSRELNPESEPIEEETLHLEEKDKALASCSVLAMPSEFENLGNVILEGLVRRIPCIATTGSPWKELNECECGWWVEYSQERVWE